MTAVEALTTKLAIFAVAAKRRLGALIKSTSGYADMAKRNIKSCEAHKKQNAFRYTFD